MAALPLGVSIDCSITSSARFCTDCGTVIPSALAVLSVAQHIISLAMQGERRPAWLCRGALKALAPSMTHVSDEHQEDIAYLRNAAISARRTALKIHESISVLSASLELIAQVDQQLRGHSILSRNRRLTPPILGKAVD